MGDERSKILKEFLVRSRQIGTDSNSAGKDSQAQKPAGSQQQQELLIEPKVTIPLQNIEKQN